MGAAGAVVALPRRTLREALREVEAPPGPRPVRLQDNGAMAFLAYLRAHGSAADWRVFFDTKQGLLAESLYGLYADLCETAKLVPLSPILWGRAMRKAGCTRSKIELMRDGRRSRMVALECPGL